MNFADNNRPLEYDGEIGELFRKMYSADDNINFFTDKLILRIEVVVFDKLMMFQLLESGYNIS